MTLLEPLHHLPHPTNSKKIRALDRLARRLQETANDLGCSAGLGAVVTLVFLGGVPFGNILSVILGVLAGIGTHLSLRRRRAIGRRVRRVKLFSRAVYERYWELERAIGAWQAEARSLNEDFEAFDADTTQEERAQHFRRGALLLEARGHICAHIDRFTASAPRISQTILTDESPE